MPLPGALRTIVHPSLMAILAPDFYPAAVTVQQNSPTNSGGVLTDSWAAVPGLVDLDCSVAPVSAGEQRRSEPYLRTAEETHHVAIPGYYPAITAEMRAVVTTPPSAQTGTGETLTLNILAVEHDSHSVMTRLKAEEVTH